MLKSIMTAFSVPTFVLTVGAISLAGDIQQVCNCNRGGGRRMAPAFMESGTAYDLEPIVEAPGAMPGMMPGGMPMLANPAPPPGTLGRTYTLPARPVPADRHPRVGMLDVKASMEVEVFVGDTFEFREEDDVEGYRDERDGSLWHFETKPLIPGQPHVYRVETRTPGTEAYKGDIIDVRYVRLVPGRVLTLTF
ncbi:MAG: hypothetical protein R3C01_01640 [Planctomycetaceae bacterium]